MTCLRPLALPGVHACGARGEPSAVLPSRPREQLTRHDREDKVRALAAAAALVAWLGSAYPSALRAVCGHVCSSAPVYVRVERSGEACREAAIRLDQRWPDCACSSRVPPYRGADAVVDVERLWSVRGPSIPPRDHSASLRRGFSPRLGYTCLPAGESSGVLGPRSRMSWLPIWISAGKRTQGWRGFSRRWVIMFGALVRDPGGCHF